MKSFNPVARMDLERTKTHEAAYVIEQLKQIESKGLKGVEAQNAVAQIAWGLEAHRADLREWYKGEIDRQQEKYQKALDRKAPGETLRFQKLQAKINGMSDGELLQRVSQLEGSTEYWNGDEINLITARLRSVDAIKAESLREEAATPERRAFEPWAQSGEGSQVYEENLELTSRQPGHVGVDPDDGGALVNADILTLYDANGELDAE